MVTAEGLESGANARALRVSPTSPTGRGLGFGAGFTVAVFLGAGGVVVLRFVVGAAERVVVRLVVDVLGVVVEGVVDGFALVVPTARPDPPPPQAARSRATRVIQMVCRTGIEGSPAAASGPGGPNGGRC